MKLRNKKTGIIGELHFEPDKEYHFTVVTEDPADVMIYKKLAALYADWEDYDEPKDYYFIDGVGVILTTDRGPDDESAKQMQSIGNYFETKEEAEKVVEKLKAWKRLKDKGLRFNRWTIPEEPKTSHIKLVIDGEMDVPNSPYDIDLLFGGGE